MLKHEELKKFKLLCNYYIECIKGGYPLYMFKEITRLEDDLFKDEEAKKELEIFKMIFKQYLTTDITVIKNIVDIEKLFIEQLNKMKKIICS